MLQNPKEVTTDLEIKKLEMGRRAIFQLITSQATRHLASKNLHSGSFPHTHTHIYIYIQLVFVYKCVLLFNVLGLVEFVLFVLELHKDCNF